MPVDKGGAPLGNKNNTKNKPWTDAKRKYAVQHGWYDKAAKTLGNLVEKGDMAAIKEAGDRSDGKAIHGIDLQGNLVVYEPRIKRLDGSVDADE